LQGFLEFGVSTRKYFRLVQVLLLKIVLGEELRVSQILHRDSALLFPEYRSVELASLASGVDGPKPVQIANIALSHFCITPVERQGRLEHSVESHAQAPHIYGLTGVLLRLIEFWCHVGWRTAKRL
jgi:hypothetical protein